MKYWPGSVFEEKVKVKVVTRCILLCSTTIGTVKWSSSNSSHVTALLLGMWPNHVKEVFKKKVFKNWKSLFAKGYQKSSVSFLLPCELVLVNLWVPLSLALAFSNSNPRMMHMSAMCTIAMSMFELRKKWMIKGALNNITKQQHFRYICRFSQRNMWYIWRQGDPFVCQVPVDINVSVICDGKCWRHQERADLWQRWRDNL